MKRKSKRGPKPTKNLTRAQWNTLRKLRHLTRSIGYPPTVEELANSLGRGASSVRDVLNQLDTKGYIKRVPERPRAIVVTEKGMLAHGAGT